MRIILVFVIASALATTPARAQRGPNAPLCGDLENAEAMVHVFAPYFTAPEQSAVREGLGIDALPEGFAAELVTDEGTCGRVLGRTMQLLGRNGSPGKTHRPGFDFAVFRFGPYYGIVLDEHEDVPEGVTVLHRSPLFLFTADGLHYIGGIMQ